MKIFNKLHQLLTTKETIKFKLSYCVKLLNGLTEVYYDKFKFDLGSE